MSANHSPGMSPARSRCWRGLAATAMAAMLLAGCGQDATSQEAPRPVLVIRPLVAPEQSPAYAGEVRARQESPLAFRVAGKLVERRVDVGDHVRRGDLLATLDADDLQAQAHAARAQLSAAQAQLGRVRADQARFAALARQQLVSRSAMDAQNAAVVAARGQVDAARAQLEVADNQAGYSQLRAPTDGVIAARHAEAGQVVGVGQPVFTMAADGAREVAFAVSEGEVDRIKPGDAVAVEVWSEPGQRWPGVVREVAPVADPASRTYAVRATVDAPIEALDLGQSAQVFINGADTSGLSVPLSALQRVAGDTKDEERAAVFVVDPNTATLKLQPVEIGDYGNDRVPVTDGLKPDAWVVAAGGHLLREGQKVRPINRNNKSVLD